MFKLKSLTLKNFMAFEKAHIDFSKPGLYIITGYNEVGGDSNGCGKTCIVSAISYALWGRTEGGLKKDQVTRWDTTTHLVVLELEGPMGVYRIERTPDSTKLFIDGKPVLPEAWRKGEMQDTINATFKSDPKTFFSATMFDKNLADLGDADKKKLLKGILNLDAIDEAYQKVRVKLESLSRKATEVEATIKLKTSSLPDIEKRALTYKEKAENFSKEIQEKITLINEELSQPVVYDLNMAQELKYLQDKVQLLEKESESRAVKSSSILEDIYILRDEISKSKGKVDGKQEQLSDIAENASNPKCRLCGSPLEAKHIESLKKEILIYIRKEDELQAAFSKKLKQLESDLASVGTDNLDLDSTKKKVSELRLQTLSMETRVERWEEKKKQLEKSLEELNSSDNVYEELYDQTLKEKLGIELFLSDAKSTFGTVTKDIDIYTFLKWVFSREGVASYIIEQSFNRLQTLANHYLSKVCREGFRLNISPQRELKSKVLKEEIDISILQDGRKIVYAALSGGQKQRINVALVVALFKLCRDMRVNMFDFLLLDEVLDLSLAEKGQEDMVALLRLLLSEISQVVVISHKVGIAQDFDYEIRVRRDMDKVSSIY